jgi:AcrR family transcriptional regulator
VRTDSQRARASAKIPSQERGKLRVAALLDAAESVIADNGYEAATMTEIAARAGASIGSLYQYFPTKTLVADALRTRLRDALCAELAALATAARGWTAAELARNLLATLPEFFRRRPAMLNIADANRLPLPAAADVRHRLRKEVATVLAAYAPGIAVERAETASAVIYQLMKAATALADEPRLRHRESALAEIEALVEAYLARLAVTKPSVRQVAKV